MRGKLIFALCGLLSFSLQAAEQAHDLNGKRIGVSTVGSFNYFDNRAYQGALDEVRRLGGTPIALDAGRNDGKLVAQLQTLVVQKPDAIIQILGTASVLDASLKRIQKAGIPLFSVEQPSNYSVNDVVMDNAADGELLAQKLVDDIGGEGDIIVFNGFYGVPACGARYDALKRVLQRYPKVRIVEELRDVIPNTVQDAHAQTSALLSKYPKGQLAAIWTSWDLPQLGVSQALIGAGRNEVKTYGFDGTLEVLALLDQANTPVAADFAAQPELMGRIAVRNVARYLAGESSLEKRTVVPALLATPETVAQVRQQRGDK